MRLLFEVDIENGVRHLRADGVGVMVLELVTQPPVIESALDSGLLALLPPEGVPVIKKIYVQNIKHLEKYFKPI